VINIEKYIFILATKHMEEKTDFNLNIENKQYIAAGADVTGTSQKQSSLNDYTVSNCLLVFMNL